MEKEYIPVFSSVNDDIYTSIGKKFYQEYPRKHSQTLEVLQLLDSVTNETYSGTSGVIINDLYLEII